MLLLFALPLSLILTKVLADAAGRVTVAPPPLVSTRCVVLDTAVKVPEEFVVL